jgi:hypothetical protein
MQRKLIYLFFKKNSVRGFTSKTEGNSSRWLNEIQLKREREREKKRERLWSE